MSNLKDLRYSSSTYKVKPNALPNFKIKVKLSKISSTFQLDDTVNSINYSEEFIFSWQHKVFSPRERILYSQNLPNANTVQKKYCQDVKKLNETKGFPTKRLFSYVNHDDYVHRNKAFTSQDPFTTSFVGKFVDNIKANEYSSKEVWKSGMKMNPIVEEHSEDQLIERHISSRSFQHMYIMADLGYPVVLEKPPNAGDKPDDKNPSVGENTSMNNWQPQEVMLCRISVDTITGCCVIQPDFTKSSSQQQQYVVDNPLNKENFEYTIVNASTPTPSFEKEKEVKLLKEIYARSLGRIHNLVGSNFDDQIPNNSLRLFVTGEILSAYDFEHQNIYVQFFVDVPEDWLVSNLETLTGVTQISRGKVTENGYLCYFSFPFEFSILYQQNIYKNINYDSLPKWPVIFVEVFSIDSWSRYRTEGYGYSQIPTFPGMHNITINCWRPTSDSITNDLRRFFVGGSAELEDLTFANVPATFEGNLLSKYGFRTIPTGNVVLRMNCLQQSNSFIDEKLNRNDARHLVDRMGGSNVHFGVMEVINAFRRARERLIHVREGDINLTVA